MLWESTQCVWQPCPEIYKHDSWTDIAMKAQLILDATIMIQHKHHWHWALSRVPFSSYFCDEQALLLPGAGIYTVYFRGPGGASPSLWQLAFPIFYVGLLPLGFVFAPSWNLPLNILPPPWVKSWTLYLCKPDDNMLSTLSCGWAKLTIYIMKMQGYIENHKQPRWKEWW